MILNTHIKENNEIFTWDDKLGVGYLKSNASNDDTYDLDYFTNYQRMAKTPIGKELNYARVKFTNKHTSSTDLICDIGIGSGAFVYDMKCHGFDVNKHAVEWLKNNDYYGDPYKFKYDWLTMWDVLEHIDDLKSVLTLPKKGVILSMPIYKNYGDCINSKHFKPNEHIWYFTQDGLCNIMKKYGYTCVDVSDIETKIGRESILSFCFVRDNANTT